MREKLKNRQPDIYIDAGTGRFQALDFLKVRDILAAAAPAKEKLKGQLMRMLGAEVLPVLAAPEPMALLEAEPALKPQRRLLKRLRSPRRKLRS